MPNYKDIEIPTPKNWAIYTRCSSDEGTGKQVKSLPDQMRFCEELAKKEGIKVKPEYKFAENGSAKESGKRPIFDKIIDHIKKGKIDGLIAWHPDRLSRNMLESGIIIDLLDMDKIIDLKLCTHHFENFASGKMMLGIMFAISKEYSDSLSERIARGVGTNFDEGKSAGTYKWGYERNEQSGWYEPHPHNFKLVKQAWKMRLEGKTYEKILEWLERMDCKRVTKKDNRTIHIHKSVLTKMFADSMYFGILKQAEDFVDLREIYEFQPMITENEFRQVRALSEKKNKRKTKLFLPLRENLVTCTCGSTCYPDVGTSKKSVFLYLVCRKKTQCPNKKHRMRMRELMNAITEYIKENFKTPTKKDYEAYLKVLNDTLEKDMNDTRKTKQSLQNKLTRTEKSLNELVMGRFKSEQRKSLCETESKVYEREKFKLEETIIDLKEAIENTGKNSILHAFNYEEFSNFLQNASVYWKKATDEEKHALAKFLFSKLEIGNGKVHQIAVKPIIDTLFVRLGGAVAQILEPLIDLFRLDKKVLVLAKEFTTYCQNTFVLQIPQPVVSPIDAYYYP